MLLRLRVLRVELLLVLRRSVAQVLLSDALHLSLHDLVLVDELLIRDRGFRVFNLRLFLLAALVLRQFGGDLALLRKRLLAVERRLVLRRVIDSERRLERIDLLADDVLVVFVVRIIAVLVLVTLIVIDAVVGDV